MFENTTGNKNVGYVSDVNDETQNKISDKVSELSVPGTCCDWQSHTHHVVTGQTTQTIQIPEFLTGCILLPRNPPPPQHQKLSTQVSNFPIVEQSPGNQH